MKKMALSPESRAFDEGYELGFAAGKELCRTNESIEILKDLEKVREVGFELGFEAGQKAALQWQPIETAPKDGTVVILFNQDWECKCALGCWELNFDGEGIPEYFYWNMLVELAEDYHDPDYEPTHWLPLPPAPEVSE